MSFQSLKDPGEGEITVKKSRFIGRAFPVNDEAEVQAILARIRKQDWEARHHCYAYRLSDNGLSRFSDDGEPSGTAGKPILDVLAGKGLYDTLIVVTRYFGGVLLGTGGLVRAYSEAAAVSLNGAEILDHQDAVCYGITCSYAAWPKLERFLRENTDLAGVDFTNEVGIQCWVENGAAEKFETSVVDLTDGRCVPKVKERGMHCFSLN